MSSTDSGGDSTTSPAASSSVSSLSFSSSYTPTSSSSAADADDTGIDSTGPSLASSASLYLYTFLATLILLLGVSAAIVVRSLILRRRHRALVEEAIRNGTWIPPATRPRVDLSKKPKLHEAYLDSHGAHQSHTRRAEDWLSWDGILPFSATYANPPSHAPPAPVGVPTEAPLSPPRRRWWSWSRAPSAEPSSAGQTELTERTPPAPTAPTQVRVGVIIAMPTPHTQKPETSVDEEPLPPLEMGISDVVMRGGPLETEEANGSKPGRDSGSSEH
ncbi:hypothetical protein BD626DRAFT_490003 [Schizophyllum amplum]|uniref:Uncharacterized protein n=1 Tax=Schizophyllum amplum TaxID=97359 RepID=A0A550CJ39_9AGAR|nr:hypothetical protein BD626DRAFT_490003 [Auriculariopsis ampla]